MATMSQPRGLFPQGQPSAGPTGIPEITVPLVLLKNLLDTVGGAAIIDEFDIINPIDGHLEASTEQGPWPTRYRFRWVEE